MSEIDIEQAVKSAILMEGAKYYPQTVPTPLAYTVIEMTGAQLHAFANRMRREALAREEVAAA